LVESVVIPGERGVIVFHDFYQRSQQRCFGLRLRSLVFKGSAPIQELDQVIHSAEIDELFDHYEVTTGRVEPVAAFEKDRLLVGRQLVDDVFGKTFSRDAKFEDGSVFDVFLRRFGHVFIVLIELETELVGTTVDAPILTEVSDNLRQTDRSTRKN
jgi:hypothetical protein